MKEFPLAKQAIVLDSRYHKAVKSLAALHGRTLGAELTVLLDAGFVWLREHESLDAWTIPDMVGISVLQGKGLGKEEYGHAPFDNLGKE